MTKRLHATTLVAAAVLLGACGGSSVSAQQRFDTAVQQAKAQSSKFTFTLQLSVDSSKAKGLTAGQLQELQGLARGVTLTGSGMEQGTARASMQITIPGRTQPVAVVLYDGATYIALDGKRFAQQDLSALTGGLSISLNDPSPLDGAFTSLDDQGTTTDGGDQVEHLHGVYDRGIISRLIGGSGSQIGGIIAQLLQLDSGTSDAFVRLGDGNLERLTSQLQAHIDVAQLAGLLGALGQSPSPNASGTVNLGMQETLQYSDWNGGDISVSKPAVDPAAPTLEPPHLPGFGGGGGSASPSPAATPSPS